ncbi:Predicted lipid-binding transport protein, Tim44 family [Methylomagnum ishizawai]|uniref:Predicted lipid-binding transport protein, Tim44 family n=1 Tax=Methylomagnum ishizawai TaxID=1760988 RepID=A0A1Y6CV08_9GAMM|nr:TIM44-like domain-containing protein [Methylomagnum ishizawai]SMF94489.1 Predicted lipid-binding transport protein, Tim44 family [Methylomagnum ishizawai]
MKKLTGLMFSVLIAATLAVSGSGDAYAKRLGGGSSFGSRPSYSQPYSRSATPSTQPGYGQPGATAQQPAYSPAAQRNQGIRDSLAQRGGFMRMLGGLALGGLLGAMLFGGGFEGINFLDILLFAGVAFLLFKLFAARRGAAMGRPAPAQGYYPPEPESQSQPYQRQAGAGFDTDVMSTKNHVGGTAGFQAAPALPADFDAAAFLNGAKAAYALMQQAWDRGDLADLRSLTTDKVFGELQDQLRARGGAPNQTELLQVEAEILEVRDAGADREVAVLFDTVLREAPGAAPAQVREVWHFTRPRNSRQPTWFLDGIQQVEA